MSGTTEIILFPKAFAKMEQWLEEYTVFIVKGALDLTSPEKCKIKANLFVPVELFFEQWPEINRAALTLPANLSNETIQEFATLCKKGSTTLTFNYQENGKTLNLVSNTRISINQNFVEAIKKHQGSIKLTI